MLVFAWDPSCLSVATWNQVAGAGVGRVIAKRTLRMIAETPN